MAEMEPKKLAECLDYFRQRPVYEKLFQKFREKYASLGHMGGKVVLSGLTLEEKQQLGGFLQKDYTENKTVTVSAELLEKRLGESRFSGISGETLLRAYFGKKLTVKKEEKQKEEEKRNACFAEILEGQEENPAGKWLKEVLENRGSGYELLMQQYRENPAKLEEILESVMRASKQLNHIKKRQLLAVFAAQTTGNPHYFDTGETAEKLLILFLKHQFPGSYEKGITPAEERNHLLYQAGILKDDLSNETLAYGLHAWKQDGSMHEGIEGFLREQEPVRLTLRTLGEIGEIRAQQKEIYVVENPAVFSVLTSRNPACAAVCVSGQPRLATLLLLDFLKENHRFWYAGDFDPEGLLIAQRLKERYGEALHFWKYEAQWYEQYLSSVRLSESRIKKLEHIYMQELQGIKEGIQKRKRAAYQEAMLEIYQEIQTASL